MGTSFSCAGEEFYDAYDSFEALVRSISFGKDANSSIRSVSFNGRETKPAAIFKAFGSGKLYIEGSVSFNGKERDPFHLETKISIKTEGEEEGAPVSDTMQTPKFSPMKKQKKNKLVLEIQKPDLQFQTSFAHLNSPHDQAAVKVQKVYRSFRTRRQLADCAVLVEQHWWKLIDFALLKRSSVSFFDIERPESAVSRWSRARTRAAKVGKGLSRDEKAQKLALQHWLEAIDPRHRYGHNLSFYYDCWLHCESRQPFFYWLDVGEGREVNLEKCCPRSKLQQQCIKYLGPKEREAYEVIIEDGKFMYKQRRELVDTTGGPKGAKWIFVLSTTKTLYVSQKAKGTFQHSSFLAGGATSSAGQLIVEDGILKAVWAHSGHYRPTEDNFQEFMTFLQENNVNVTDVQKFAIEEDADASSGLVSNHLEQNSVENNELAEAEAEAEVEISSIHETSEPADLSSSATNIVSMKEQTTQVKGEAYQTGTALDGNVKSAKASKITPENYLFVKRNLFLDEVEEENEAFVPPEKILGRINSKKESKSYQLGKQLSCTWTTGAGPRIGCLRDYPSELQVRALEQVQLSPRGEGHSSRLLPSPRPPTCSTPGGTPTPTPKALPQIHRLKTEG